MSVNLTAELFRLVSAQHFVQALADDLAQGRSVIVLLPMGVEPLGIWLAVRSKLWQSNYDVREIVVSGLPLEVPPVLALGEALQVTWPPTAPRTLECLLLLDDLPDVIQLDGFERLTGAAVKQWLTLIQNWAHVPHTGRRERSRLPALCTLMPAQSLEIDSPKTADVRLAVHWWWAIPSALEIALLCSIGQMNGTLDSAARWREHVLPSLAGNDLKLVELLWDRLDSTPAELAEWLCCYSQQQGWTRDRLEKWGADRLTSRSTVAEGTVALEPPRKIKALWANGALSYTAEFGLELHLAAALTLGQEQALTHRLWRGQASLMLSQIDETRLSLCNYLTSRYGSNWPLLWDTPQSSEELDEVKLSPMGAQWGYLEHLLRTCPALRSERRWLTVASIARQIRNDLAHYRPVRFRDYQLFWQEAQRWAI